MTKVVYNADFGGFSLSDAASRRVHELDPSILVESCGRIYLPRDIARHNAALVQAVEELGAAANGTCATLKIIEVKGPYRIDEYDGWETVVEPEDYEWVTP